MRRTSGRRRYSKHDIIASCVSRIKNTITITITNQNTGIKNVEFSNNVNIYPTLADNELTIAGNTNFMHIEIFNLQGKLMKCMDNVAAGGKINISSLTPGIYMIRISDYKNFSTTKKFVKE